MGFRESKIRGGYLGKTQEDRFWEKVDRSRDCWCWLGAVNERGYGQFDGGQAHRYSWQLKNGKIPNGLSVLHKCDNSFCVNPKHLWLGTQADNVHDSMKKGRRDKRHGSRNPAAIFTERQVLEIRSLHHRLKYRELAERYNCSIQTINDILSRRRWTHI